MLTENQKNEQVKKLKGTRMQKEDLNYITLQKGDIPKLDFEVHGGEKIGYDSTGNPRRIYFVEETDYLGLTWQKNYWLTLWPYGGIKHGRLAKNGVYMNFPVRGGYKGGSLLRCFENGQPYKFYLSETTDWVVGKYVFEFRKDTVIRLVEYGSVLGGYQDTITTLFAPYPIIIEEGVVSFHKNTNIRTCTVKNGFKFKYKGRVYNSPKKSKVNFHELNSEGKASLSIIHNTKGMVIDNLETKNTFSFYPGKSLDEPGSILRFQTPRRLIFQNHDIKSGSDVGFHTNGKLDFFRVNSNYIFQGKRLIRGDFIRLYDNGNIKSIKVANKDRIINGVKICRSGRITFDLNGETLEYIDRCR